MKRKHLISTVNREILPTQKQEMKTNDYVFNDDEKDDFISDDEDRSTESSKHPYSGHNKETEEKEREEVIKVYLCPFSSCIFSLHEKNSTLEKDHLKGSHPNVDNLMSFMVLE